MDKKFLAIVLGVLLAAGMSVPALAQMELYSNLPPFVTQNVPPNIMLIVDNSGSMYRFAYFDGWNTASPSDDNWGDNSSNPSTGFNPAYTYYGYFEPTYWYSYGNSRFTPAALKSSRAKGAAEWDGNFLNWLTMRRVDVLRKVLTGGDADSSGRLNCQSPDDTSRGAYRRVSSAQNYTPYSGTVDFTVYKSGSTPTIKKGSDSYVLNIVTVNPISGVLQRIGGKARWGLAFYSPNTSGLTHATDQGGFVQAALQTRDNASLTSSVVNEINLTDPSTNTPLAEVLWTMTGYYAQQASLLGGPGPMYKNGDYQINSGVDPYNYGTGGSPIYAWCAKSFVLLVTDGEPCADGYLPSSIANYAQGRSAYNCNSTSNIMTDPCYCESCSAGGYVPGIEDVALWAHTNDLRSDLSGRQNYDFYGVFAFGAGSRLLKYACINGGFIDQNGNNLPDLQAEWDEDGNNEPDTYFAAPSGQELEAKIEAAITSILRRVASGTAVSVLATSAEGEGSLFQAYFRPGVIEGTREVSWPGYLQGLWVDQYGHLREDTTPDKRMVYTQDRIIKYVVGVGGETVVEKYSDTDGNGYADSTTPDATVPLENLSPLWEAGKQLALRSASDRVLYTYVDLDNDGVKDSGEWMLFNAGNAATLRPYLQAADTTEATNIINFIRGEQITGYRDRQLTVAGTANQVWKLGDIIYSSPSVVGKPISNYDLIYRDSSYLDFTRDNAERDVMVYVGANDGMLHGFWTGVFHEGDDPSTPSVQETGWYSTSALCSTFGQELWGYIPYNLLPHLKWLTSTSYTPNVHVYYVDLEPVIADVKVSGQWRTVLIGGMRFGGGPITVTADYGSGTATSRTFRSAYFALDVTVPNSPELLWEFTDARLGYTLALPSVVKIGTDYFVVFGSGPNDVASASSSQQGRIFVVDLVSGQLRRVIDTSANGFVAQGISLDTDVNFSTDVLYLGETYSSAGVYYGKMHRLVTGESSNPATWTLSTLFATEAGQPVTSAPSAAYDTSRHLWVCFGTGKYLCTYDKADVRQQSVYGVKDPCYAGGCTTTVSRTNLRNTTAVVMGADCNVTGAGSGINNETQLVDAVQTGAGWYRNLFYNGTQPSERVIQKPIILSGRLVFTTFRPTDDMCGFGGSGRLYGLNFLTGAPPCIPVFGNAPGGFLELGGGVPSRPTVHRGRAPRSGAPPTTTILVQNSNNQIQAEEGTFGAGQETGVILWRELR